MVKITHYILVRPTKLDNETYPLCFEKIIEMLTASCKVIDRHSSTFRRDGGISTSKI